MLCLIISCGVGLVLLAIALYLGIVVPPYEDLDK